MHVVALPDVGLDAEYVMGENGSDPPSGQWPAPNCITGNPQEGGETNALNPLPMTVCHPTDNAWGKQRVTGHRTRSNISRNIREKNTVTQCSVDIHDLLYSLPTNKANNNGETGSRNWKPECLIKLKLKKRSFFLCLSKSISFKRMLSKNPHGFPFHFFFIYM